MRLNRLRELREDRGLSQEMVGQLVHTSQQNIHKYENGIAEPNIQMLKSLATLFHTSIDYLVEYDPEEYPELLDVVDPNQEYEVQVPPPNRTEHIDSDRLHLLLSYDRCKPPIQKSLLNIVEELGSRKANDTTDIN